MKVYDDKHIKNVVLVGAPKSSKTTLSEAMLFEAGLINRRGTVEEEHRLRLPRDRTRTRQLGLRDLDAHRWKDYKINIIDTPGLDDFIGEVIATLRVADTAVMLLNAENGVEIGSELIWNYVENSRNRSCSPSTTSITRKPTSTKPSARRRSDSARRSP